MSATFEGAQLDLELMDPGGPPLVRLFRHPGGDWQEPPLDRRDQRVDPPAGHAGDYSVLYTADSLAAVAIECRILNCDSADRYTYDVQRTAEYSVVRYQLRAPAIFIPIDGENKRTLGLRFPDPLYAQHRGVAHQLFGRYGSVVHGLSWASYHRNQPGRVYALWHHHKDTVGLAIIPQRPTPSWPTTLNGATCWRPIRSSSRSPRPDLPAGAGATAWVDPARRGQPAAHTGVWTGLSGCQVCPPLPARLPSA